MTKNINKFLNIFFLILMTILYVNKAEAAIETFVINKYSESFMPGQNKDAILNVEMIAVTSDEGMIYIPINIEKSEIISTFVNEKKFDAEKIKMGGVSYFLIKTKSPNLKVNVKAEIACKNFYAVKNDNPATGIPKSLMEYKFINKSLNKIDSYNLTIALPDGMEPISVITPKNVTKYTLSENEKGQRTLSLKSRVAISESSIFKFTYGVPFTNKAMIKILMWIFIIRVSILVLKDRIKGGK